MDFEPRIVAKTEMNFLQPHVLAALKDCYAGKLAWTAARRDYG